MLYIPWLQRSTSPVLTGLSHNCSSWLQPLAIVSQPWLDWLLTWNSGIQLQIPNWTLLYNYSTWTKYKTQFPTIHLVIGLFSETMLRNGLHNPIVILSQACALQVLASSSVVYSRCLGTGLYATIFWYFILYLLLRYFRLMEMIHLIYIVKYFN
jgi:hypothetical protein